MKWVKIKDIKPNPHNRNKHPKDQIERLSQIITYQGWRHPLIVSNQSGLLVVGHGRLEAAKKLKLKEVPVVYQDFKDPEQEFSFSVSDNAIGLWAELDLSGIHLDLESLDALKLNLDMLGLKDFRFEPIDKVAMCDEDEIPEKVEPRTKLGDLYILGDHRLLCGDSTNIQHVERLMDGQKADMVLSDPPYGVLKVEWDRPLSFDDVAIAMSFSTGPICMFNASRTDLMKSVLNFEIIPDRIAVWRLTSSISPGHGMFRTWQPIYVWRAGALKGWDAIEWQSDSPDKTGQHPTQKPIGLLEKWIKSIDSSTVLDLFGGSGSTLIACEKTNRKCFMMELDPHFCDVIVARWEKYTGKKAEIT